PLQGCHTLLIDGYVVEGHVPVAAVRRLLAERPAIRGISLPGMPAGSPGMDGEKTEPFTVYEIGDGAPKVFARE
ncbi:metal-binding protein, partial [Streptomyces purpurogeneiscleroticus]